jgi:hypothetical protein
LGSVELLTGIAEERAAKAKTAKEPKVVEKCIAIDLLLWITVVVLCGCGEEAF